MKPLLHPRLDWLDQARGVVILVLIVSMGTAEYAGDLLTGASVLGPPMLNHGYDYFEGTPPIITFVDSGQAMFVFIMGLVGYGAFVSRLRKRGRRSSLLYAARRVILLYAISALDAILLSSLVDGHPNWPDFFYKGTFAGIALGALAAFVAVSLWPRTGPRMVVGTILILAHAVLFEFPLFDHRGWGDDGLNLPAFPFMALGMCAMAVMGSCFGQWIHENPDGLDDVFRRRITPITLWAIIGAYCMDWLQPAAHHDATAALQLQAMAIGGVNIMIFYSLGRLGIRLPVLSALGRNLLLMFLISGIAVAIYMDLLPKASLIPSPFLTVTLIGIFPMVAMRLLAMLLAKRGIMVLP